MSYFCGSQLQFSKSCWNTIWTTAELCVFIEGISFNQQQWEIIEVLLNIFQSLNTTWYWKQSSSSKLVKKASGVSPLNFIHIMEQLTHMCCATCRASNCSLGRIGQTRNSSVFLHLFPNEDRMATIFLTLIQKSEVSKTLTNVFLVGDVQLC